MDENLRNSLERLRQQLEGVEARDAAQQARLDAMRQALREALEQPDREQPATLSDRLNEAMLMLDEGNPDITLAIKEAIDTLSQAGI